MPAVAGEAGLHAAWDKDSEQNEQSNDEEKTEQEFAVHAARAEDAKATAGAALGIELCFHGFFYNKVTEKKRLIL